MFSLLLVGLGGFLGAVSRYLITGFLVRLSPAFPLGTLSVNVLGSFALGFLMALVAETLIVPPNLRLFFGIGFLGSLTTFSTFAYETNALLLEGELWFGLLNMGLNLFLGLLGMRLGLWLARLFFL